MNTELKVEQAHKVPLANELMLSYRFNGNKDHKAYFRTIMMRDVEVLFTEDELNTLSPFEVDMVSLLRTALSDVKRNYNIEDDSVTTDDIVLLNWCIQ